MLPKSFDVGNEGKERKRHKREKRDKREENHLQNERIKFERFIRSYQQNINNAMERQMRDKQMREQIMLENQPREGNKIIKNKNV